MTAGDAAATQPRPFAGKRILLVEDDYFIASDFAGALRDLGLTVAGPVASVSQALALVQIGGITGAVLDINIRGGLVYPVAEALRAKGVPFVFVTGYDAMAVPAAFADVPRYEKPLSASTLVPWLARM